MVAKRLTFLLLPFIVSACAIAQSEQVSKIALLAPFEGRYREIGYNALYASQLALQEINSPTIDLLAVDDGGNIQNAADRALALAHDETVELIIVLGPYAAHSNVLEELKNIPVLIVGQWGSEQSAANIYILSNPDLQTQLTIPVDLDIVDAATHNSSIMGSDMLALHQFPSLRGSLEDVTILSSASLADEHFRERYLNSNLFVPEPGLLAILAYDATALAAKAIRDNTPLDRIVYEGINGTIQFENGYWVDAPIYTYGFDETGQLTQLEASNQ